MSKVGAVGGVALALALMAVPATAGFGKAMTEARDTAFAEADADENGALTREEFEIFHEAMREARAEAIFTHRDVNEDGTLTADELEGRPHGRHGCDR